MSESLVGLAFVDAGVSPAEKTTMSAALLKEGNTDLLPQIRLDESYITDTSLTNLVTCNTKQLFTALSLPQDFLKKDPFFWEEDDS